LQCVLAARILIVDFVVCTPAVKKNEAGFDMSDRTIPLLVPFVCQPLIFLLHQLRMIGDDECVAADGMRIGRGNRSTGRETCPSATLSTTNLT
jgi:hypothetical protein